MSTLSLNDWMTEMAEATCETATQVFGYEASASGCVFNESASGMPADTLGSFISLASESDTVQIGILSNKEGLAILSKNMLGMTPEEIVADNDLTDAIGEVINIIAGGVKRRLNDKIGGMKLGLPIFIEGKIAQGGSQELSIADLKMGDVPVHILVMRKKG